MDLPLVAHCIERRLWSGPRWIDGTWPPGNNKRRGITALVLASSQKVDIPLLP
jgi:hypothetical protein